MTRLLTALLALVSGVLMAMAHPFRFREFILEGSVVGLCIATVGLILFIPTTLKSSKRFGRFFYGFLGGLAFYTVSLYWIAYALHEYGYIHIALSILATLLLAGYCALFFGVWSLIAGSEIIKGRSPFLKMICWASLWVSLDALRQWLFTGFGWNELGYAFSFLPIFARTTSVWGVHGLSFLWIFCAGIFLHLKSITEGHLRVQTLAFFLGGAFLIGALSLFFYPQSSDFEIRVGLVQPDISQEMKWDPAKARDHFSLLQDLTQTAVVQGAQLIVWPETALPYSLSSTQREAPFSAVVPVIFGAVIREGGINRNSAVLVERDEILQRFDKSHLVPFGEYVPFKEWLSFGKLVQNAGDFLPGGADQKLISVLNSKVSVGPLICYEDIFSRSSVAHARKGANLLANLTNDAWYGPTSAQLQHAAMSTMQVYQTGIPMLRSTNNGISSFITPQGRNDLPSFTQTSVVQSISVAEHPQKTFFVWTYPLMEWIFPLVFVIALLWKNPSRTKRIFFPKQNHY